MTPEQQQITEAAAALTPEDLGWLQENDMLPQAEAKDVSSETPTAEDDGEQASEEAVASQESSEATEQEAAACTDTAPSEKRTRKRVQHQWPEIGEIFEADYQGQHYEAEVIAAPKLKSGKALKLLTGPAAGQVHNSLSKAMLMATEAQREAEGLGRSGVANGWDFWQVKETDAT